MVNKRKVRLMARTAMYEKHEGKRELKNVMYYRSDYIGMHMLFVGIGNHRRIPFDTYADMRIQI